MSVEVENSHGLLLSAGCRTRKATRVIHSKFEGLRTRSAGI
jgi:hypothetical protein